MPTSNAYRNILCPVDFSASSRAALNAASELAAKLDSALTLVHVYQTPVLALPESSPGSPFRVSIAGLAKDELGTWNADAERVAGRRVTAVVLEGTPWDRIVKYAHEQRIDLIVIGTHGQSWIEHALVGSVAENVVRHATCPVLIVRAPRP